MAQARFDIPSHLPETLARPLYAGVGATDRVVEALRVAVADVSQRALALQKTVATIDYEPQALRQQATHATHAVAAGVAGLRSEAAGLPLRLQRIADEQVAQAGTTYGELVRRGETLVDRIRRQQSTAATAKAAKTTTAKARTTRTQATASAAEAGTTASRTVKKATKKAAKKASTSPARSSAKATGTAARKTAAQAARATGEAAAKVGD